MYQRLIEVCRQVGISLTFIKANLSARAPRISGGSVFRRNPTDTVKYIIPPPARRSLPLCRPVFLPLRPVNALPAAYLSLFSVELLIHQHVWSRHLVKFKKKQAHSPVPSCVWVLDRRFSVTLTVVGQPISGPEWKKWKCAEAFLSVGSRRCCRLFLCEVTRLGLADTESGNDCRKGGFLFQ